MDHEAKTTSWLNPVKLKELKDTSILDSNTEKIWRGEWAGIEWLDYEGRR